MEDPEMNQNVLPFPRRAPLRRQAIGPSGVIGTLIFVTTELMLFAGFISAVSITRAAYNTWAPIGQPRLPLAETSINTFALLASGVVLFFANKAFLRDPQSAKKPLLVA